MRLIKLSLFLIMTFKASANLPIDTLHLAWLNPTQAIDQDFYTYANGAWQKTHPIPAAYPNWSPFNELQIQNLKRIHTLLKQCSASPQTKTGSIEQKIGDFYYSGMDKATINRVGLTPLAPYFSRIQAIKTSADLQAEITYLHRIGIPVFFSLSSMTDFKHSTNKIGAISQSGITLPDRDYYLKKGPKFDAIRLAYQQFISRMLMLAGEKSTYAQSAASTILRLETLLASASMSQAEQRNPHAIYHMLDINQLQTLAPNFLWSRYFSDMGIPHIKHINVAMPKFITAMNRALISTPIEEWKIYLRWQLLSSCAAYLSDPFVKEDLKMTSVLSGAEKLLPRWERVVSTENEALGFAIGEMYIKEYFSPSAKKAALEITNNIRQALIDDLKTLPWMTETTRQAALHKLALMEERIGYPEKTWDYATLTINRGPYILNVLRGSQFLTQRDLNKIGKPVDRKEWDMTPQTINAYYDPSMNTITLPAGILQAPFFDPNAPAAVNYGAIGFVIGHEITHGFDDMGAKFDAKGNLNNWWTPTDLEKFKAATQCIVDQFSHYNVNGDTINGRLVVGEATADLGGLTLAYRAFQHSNAFSAAKPIKGISPDQQFFLSAAHVWANNTRPELAHQLLTTDPHPPAKYRVNGTFANMPEFKRAYGLDKIGPMVNQNPCTIW